MIMMMMKPVPCSYLSSPHKFFNPPFALPLNSKTQGPCFGLDSKLNSIFLLNKPSSSFGFPICKSSGLDQELEQQEERRVMIEKNLLAHGFQREYMPRHITFILDGNRRWAKKHNLPLSSAHDNLANVKGFCHLCIQLGIPVLSDYLFSTLNWTRSQIEIDYMMYTYEKSAKELLESYIKDGIKVSFLGDYSRLPISFTKVIAEVEEATKNNTNLHLIYGVGYGGRFDMTQACKTIAHKVKDGVIDPEQVNESLVEQHLQTNCIEFPHTDLFIRPGGKQRLSDYYLWNFSYSELYFSELLGPDFGEKEFIEAIRTFHHKRRKFGEQVQ